MLPPVSRFGTVGETKKKHAAEHAEIAEIAISLKIYGRLFAVSSSSDIGSAAGGISS